MWSLLGIPVVVAGLIFRLNPILAVTAGAIVTGLAGGKDIVTIISTLGKGFNDARYISAVFLILPVIGVLERAGLQARARTLVASLRGVSVGGLLWSYFTVRQVSAALGLLSLGGHASMVRPLIAPMAEGADEVRHGSPSEPRRTLIRAHAAAVDNIGAFFGEDIFIAVGSVLLIQAVLETSHITVQPLAVSLWAIPTALAAFIVHSGRLALLDRRLARQPALEPVA